MTYRELQQALKQLRNEGKISKDFRLNQKKVILQSAWEEARVEKGGSAHAKKLFGKAVELKNKGFEIADVLDVVYDFHREVFFRGCSVNRAEFNAENKLSVHARPEKSLHIVAAIVENAFAHA